MLLSRLNQAKRKLVGSMSEHVRASKKYKNNFADDQTSLFPTSDGSSRVCESRQPKLPMQPFEPQSDINPGHGNLSLDNSKSAFDIPGPAKDLTPAKVTETMKRVDHGLFVEIFAGSAGLTAAVRKVGLSASVGIDSSVSAKCRAPVIRLDASSWS